MFHQPSTSPSQQAKYNSILGQIKVEEKHLHRDFKQESQMREYNNMRREHSPGVKFRNNIPTTYDQAIRRYL
jgi:hypothetical protein